MKAAFLLDSDSIEVEGLPCDGLSAAAWERGSRRLLKALNRARGVETIEEAGPPCAFESFTPPVAEPENIFLLKFDLIARLIDSIAADFGITHGELIGDGRDKVLVHARSVFIRLLLDRGYSASGIGKRFLRRDHSSILHSRDNFDVYRQYSPLVAHSYERHARMAAEAAQ